MDKTSQPAGGSDTESMLLMYLAEELAPEQRAAIENLLRSEATLQQQLQQLRAAQEATERGLRALDAATPIPGSREAAIRQVGRNIRQWHVDRIEAASRRIEPRPQLRFPWWSYPLTAAVAITFAFLAWWRTIPAPDQLAQRADPTEVQVTPQTDDTPNLVDSFDSSDAPTRFAWADPLEDMQDLSELESEIRRLQWLRESMQ